MHILMTGGTGFIGSHLTRAMLARGNQVTLWVRSVAKAQSLFPGRVNIVESLDDVASPVDAIVNLAGEAIIGARWSDTRKKALLDSRIQTTKILVDWINVAEHKPQVLVSGSAIGYYGNYPEDIELTEAANPRACFASELCQQWEAEALKAEDLGVRVCRVRTGVVLDQHAGALNRMWLPFKAGLGGRVASGKQWFSWIHRQDMIDLLLFMIDTQTISGAVNAVAPKPVIYDTFTDTFAKTLKRKAWLPMPSLLLNIMLGEAASLLIEGQKVVPKALLDAGFEFQFEEIDKALEEIVAEGSR